MRQLARFETEDTAATLGDYLYANGIDNRVDEAREGGYILWVHDETKLDDAKEALRLFEEKPDDPRFGKARRQAESLKKKKENEAKKAQAQTVNMRKRWELQRGVGPLTLGLIVITLGVAFLTTEFSSSDGIGIGEKREVVRYFLYATRGGTADILHGPFYEIRSGEVWRLITPIFIHFGLLHLVFNMWWLRDLGTQIERRQSTWLLAIMVLTIGVLSNTGQYLTGSWNFGGMSGVVYGLFGYVWIRGKLDPGSGYSMSRINVIIMLGFFAICFTGLIGAIANAAHTVGLVLGAAWGFIASAHHKRLGR